MAAFCPSDLSLDTFLGVETNAASASSFLSSAVDTLAVVRQLRAVAGEDAAEGLRRPLHHDKEPGLCLLRGLARDVTRVRRGARSSALRPLPRFFRRHVALPFVRARARPSKPNYTRCEKCCPIVFYAVFAS